MDEQMTPSAAEGPAGKTWSDAWVVIAAYNEAQVIEAVVRKVRTAFSNVIVVDDGSRDSTGLQARAGGAMVVTHPINLGQGASLQTGIDAALRCGAQLIVTFDADGQHRIEDAIRLARAVRNGEADIACGSRFLGRATGLPPVRRAVLKMAVLFTRVTSGVHVTDAHNGLRAISREAALRLRITQNRMAHASELINEIGASGLRMIELPVEIVYTKYSLQKGQKLSNSFGILVDLLMERLRK